jgi:hypothetical protein
MKYLKTFESYDNDIATQIAEDLLPKLQKHRIIPKRSPIII